MRQRMMARWVRAQSDCLRESSFWGGVHDWRPNSLIRLRVGCHSWCRGSIGRRRRAVAQKLTGSRLGNLRVELDARLETGQQCS